MSAEIAARQTSTATRPDVHVTGRRVVSTIVDGLVFGVLYGAMAALFGTVSEQGDAYWTATMPVAASIAYGLLVFLYYLVLESYRGQTLGKMVTGIRVIDEVAGDRPSFGAVLVRTILRLVDGIAGYLVAFVTVLVTSRRQRLGDLAARTLVVRSR